MRPTQNIVVIPPYYKGTSFADIVLALQSVIRDKHLSVDVVGELQPLSNTVPSGRLDDGRFVTKNVNVIKQLFRFPGATRFLFLDFYALGLDMLLYSHSQKGMRDCRYGALVHGGSFLADDLYSWSWLRQFEQAWAVSLHRLYVPSRHLFQNLPDNWRDRARVFSWGMDGMRIARREAPLIDVVFPHRLDSDKGVESLIEIIRRLPGVSFTLTTPQTIQRFVTNPVARRLKDFSNVQLKSNLDNAGHLKTLQRARIVLSCATQENFGYAVIKSIMSGCIPVVPDRLCYPEFIPAKYRYRSTDEAVRKITFFTKNWKAEHRDRKIEDCRNRVSRFSFEPLLRNFFRL